MHEYVFELFGLLLSVGSIIGTCVWAVGKIGGKLSVLTERIDSIGITLNRFEALHQVAAERISKIESQQLVAEAIANEREKECQSHQKLHVSSML